MAFRSVIPWSIGDRPLGRIGREHDVAHMTAAQFLPEIPLPLLQRGEATPPQAEFRSEA